MTELEKILLIHAEKYPLMQPCDAVKLIYQNEFGGGHLIKDRASCLKYLINEYGTIAQDGGELSEAIGNGIIRVRLAALDAHYISPELLCDIFIESSKAQTGSLELFLGKLALLNELCSRGVFGFDKKTLDDYLSAYEKLGYPPVSHSEEYRSAYMPAYRIVKASLLSALHCD